MLDKITGNKNEDGIVLSNKLIIFIMESTHRFEFLEYSILNNLIFWDCVSEREIHINNEKTITQLMSFINKIYSDEAEYKGRSKIQLEIKKLLNIK